MEFYKQFSITEKIGYVWKKNPISGYEWTEPIDKAGVTIDCSDTLPGLIYGREHRSVAAAKAEIDYVLKFPFFAY